MLIDIALVVAAAAEDAVPVAAMSIVVDVPMSMSMCDMSMFANTSKASKKGDEAGMIQDWEACGQEWMSAGCCK